MPRISELHYSNAYAKLSGVSEFLEVALDPFEDPADFVVGFYDADGTRGIEVTLDDPRIDQFTDPETGELVFVLSAENFPILLTDPDSSTDTNYEAYALTNTDTGEVVDFYDIGGGTQNIVAQSGAAAGAVSENLVVIVGPESTTTSIQFNQPSPETLTYAETGAGDTGIACFVAGTLLDTPRGPQPVEDLRIGDAVTTHDHGPCPVRWIGRRTVSGLDDYAPICFAEGAYGATRPVLVSPQHRILVRGWRAQLHCGEDEVLIAAKALVDGQKVVIAPRQIVTYVHVLFENHQILCSNGLLSESYFPFAKSSGVWAEGAADEVFGLFPEMSALDMLRTVRPVQAVRFGPVFCKD